MSLMTSKEPIRLGPVTRGGAAHRRRCYEQDPKLEERTGRSVACRSLCPQHLVSSLAWSDG